MKRRTDRTVPSASLCRWRRGRLLAGLVVVLASTALTAPAPLAKASAPQGRQVVPAPRQSAPLAKASAPQGRQAAPTPRQSAPPRRAPAPASRPATTQPQSRPALRQKTKTKTAPTSTHVTIPAPIPTSVRVVVEKKHGVQIKDPYRWLEQGNNPKVIRWSKAQNRRTRKVLDAFPLRKKIKKELTKLYNTRLSYSPIIRGKRYFIFRKEGLKNQPILYLREGSYNAPERVVLDPNTFSKDGTIALRGVYPSPDGSLLAYVVNKKGSDWGEIRVRWVTNGLVLPERIRVRFSSVVWDHLMLGFYYTAPPPKGSVPQSDENYYGRIFYHRLGTHPRQDRLIMGERRSRTRWYSPYTSSNRTHLLLGTSKGWTANDLYYRPLDGRGPFLPLVVGLNGRFMADVLEDHFLLYTDYKAPRGHLLLAPIHDPRPKNWKTLIPQQRGVLKSFRIIGDKLVLLYREDVASRLMLYSLQGKFLKEIKLPTLGTVSSLRAKRTGHELFFLFTSYAYPTTLYRYDLQKNKLQRVEKLNIAINPKHYVTKRAFYRSKDGTRVPLFLVYRKGLQRDGKRPTLLYGYGGFNHSLEPRFLSSIFPWIDRGGIFALANIRGGGEYGRQWHLAGRRGKKQNTFDDFIAAAEWLIRHRYTNSQKLAIMGGSNGGLLVSAVMVQRPRLFRAIVCQVPVADMLRFHLSTVGRYWIPEYGNPEKAKEFRWLYAYSPYHKLQKGTPYPAMLIMTAEHDDRVDPLHSRKLAARLQATTSSNHPILLRIESKAGHGHGTPLSKRIGRYVDRWVFLMWQLGMLSPQK